MSPKGETWVKGMTYYISAGGTYTVPTGSTLVIEPGVIIKGSAATNALTISGNLICKGTLYDPIYFVPGTQDGLGITITDMWKGTPPTYVTVSSTGSAFFENVKFYGGQTAINYSYGIVASDATQQPQVVNCVFRDQTMRAIYYGNPANPAELTVFNSLFVGPGTGCNAAIECASFSSQACNIEIANCTFAGLYNTTTYNAPVYIPGSKTSTNYRIVNNVFKTNTAYGINLTGRGSTETGSICNNVCNTGIALYSNGPLPAGVTVDSNNTYTFSFAGIQDNYFNTSALHPTLNGNYYLELYDTDPNSRLFADQGMNPSSTGAINISSAVADILKKTSVFRPLRIGDSGTWNINATSESSAILDSSKVSLFPDSSVNDIGYHYPLVHGVMKNDNIICTADIGLLPGTAIASLGQNSVFKFNGSNLSFKAIGTPSSYIRFIDYAQAGDDALRAANIFTNIPSPVQSRADKYFDIDVTKMKPQGVQFQYCIFERAKTGIRVYGPSGADYPAGKYMRPVISDSIFRYNGTWTQRYTESYIPCLEGGVGINYCDADVMNCLFENNRMGVYINNLGNYAIKTQFQPSVIGCTFSGGNYGMFIAPGYAGYNSSEVKNDHTYALIEDNIFSNIAEDSAGGGLLFNRAISLPVGLNMFGGIGYCQTTLHLTAIIRNNLFWNNVNGVTDEDNQADVNLNTYQIQNYQIGSETRTNFPNVESNASDPAYSPMFCNYSSTSPSTKQWRADDEASLKYYLAGGSSREPLVTGRIIGVDKDANFPAGISLKIYGSTAAFVGGSNYGIPSPDLFTPNDATNLKYSNSVGPNTSLSYTLVLLTIPSSYYVSPFSFALRFRSKTSDSGIESKVQCKIPVLNWIPATQYLLAWIAQDGSLYWARADHQISAQSAPDTDVFTALHYDTGGLYTSRGTGTSPAIDKGSADYISGGSTSTDNAVDHTLPKDYRTGYIRRTEYGNATNEDVDQETMLNTANKGPIDLGFHYGGTAQDYAPKANPPGSGSWQGYTTLAPAIRLMPEVPTILRISSADRFHEAYSTSSPDYASSWPDYSAASYHNGTTSKTTIFSTYTTAGQIHDDYTGVPASPSYTFPDSTGNTWPMPPISALFCRETDDGGASWNGSLTRATISPDALIWRNATEGGITIGQTYFPAPLYTRVPVRPGHISSIDSVAIPSNITIAGGNPLQNGDKFVVAYVSYFKKKGSPNPDNPQPTPLITPSPTPTPVDTTTPTPSPTPTPELNDEETYLWKHDYQKDTSKISIFLAKHTDGVGSYIQKIQNGDFSATPSSSYWSASPAAAWTFSNHVDAVLTSLTPGPATLTQNCPVLANRKYYFSCNAPVMEGSGSVTVQVGNSAPQPLISGLNGFVVTAAQTMTTGSFVITITKSSDTFKVDIYSVSLTLMDFVELSCDAGVSGNPELGSQVMDGSIAVSPDSNGVIHLFWTLSTVQDMSYLDGIMHATYDPVNQAIIPPTLVNGVFGVGQPADVYSSTDSTTWDDHAEPRHLISATLDKRVGRIRVVWPKASTGLLRTGRYNAVSNTFVDGNPTDLTPNSSSLNAQMVNSIAYSNYNTASVPPWLKSSTLKTENFIASDKSTWRCTTSGTSDESDDWGTRQDQPDLSVSSGYARTTVAARGLRVPRYAGRGDGIQDGSGLVSGSVYADGIITIGRGRQPVIRTNANNFIDQYIVSQTSPIATNDGSIATDAPLAVVPMRP